MEKDDLLMGLLQDLDEGKAEKLWVYQVSEYVNYTDYVIILTAYSGSHVRALIAKTEEYFKNHQIDPYIRTRKQDNFQWVVLDYGFIIIHYFQAQEREFYQLDRYFQKLLPVDKYHPYPAHEPIV